jgi:hypothetical protein
MTAERRAEPAGNGSPPELSVSTVLAVCDGLLGEIGRPDHRFSWLQAPDSGPGEWLPVSAYYPGKRLVIMCGLESDPQRLVYEELIPAHGLRLLRVTVGELPADQSQARDLLEVRIAALVPDPPPAHAPGQADGDERARPVASAIASLVRPVSEPAPTAPALPPGSQAAAVERAARLLAARRAEAGDTWSSSSPPSRGAPSRRSHPAPTGREHSVAETAVLDAPGLLLGLAVAAVVAFEIYVAVADVALSSGQLVLALGILLDGCARALGAVAAGKVDRPDWAWGCVIVGSPAVAAFALFQREGPVMIEPGPLAGLVSLAAMGLVAIALIGWILGI